MIVDASTFRYNHRYFPCLSQMIAIDGSLQGTGIQPVAMFIVNEK